MFLFFLSCCFIPAAVSAQEADRCGTQHIHGLQLQQNPGFMIRRLQQEQFTQDFAARQKSMRTMSVITIPVVFHVVFENAAENIPDFRLDSQLVALNRDYRKLNSDVSNVPSVWQSLASDCEIQFCRAGTDPNGNATSGITRTGTTVTAFPVDNSVMFAASGGHDIWDRDKYLNIWICDLVSGTLGYAAFPGGSPSTDGVVLDYSYTGTTGATAPYNKGRSGTHEVGHWLNLEHIWGNDGGSCSGTDYCTDTPNQGNWNFTCHSPNTVITDNCSPNAPGIMWMNYMDYTDDACMYMFTYEQKVRMQATLNGIRSGILTSNGCVVSVAEQEAGQTLRIFPSPSSGLFTLHTGSIPAQELDIHVYTMPGQQVYHRRLEALHEKEFTLDLTELASGMYFVQVNTGAEKVTRKVIIRR